MKRILFLGGAPAQIAPIRYALEQGHYVITCDYLSENPGHKLAHEYHNVSTTDKEAVLKLAKRLEIDGIVAFASDPAAPTAAYVGNQLGLPSNPYDSVLTLARKDLFRDFLREHGFNVPRSRSFRDREDARAWLRQIAVPVFVKPVDSSGSKGLTRLTDVSKFDEAFDHALSFSREKMVVVEEGIDRVGYQNDSDVFLVNGKLAFWIWGNQHQDPKCSPYVPVGISFPSVMRQEVQEKAAAVVSDVLKKLGCTSGAFNVEFLVDDADNVWLLEIGPRNGGNSIPQTICHATGVDMVKYTVDAALGMDCSALHNEPARGYWGSYMVHATEPGRLKQIWLSERAKKRVVEQDMWVNPGALVNKFSGSHDTLGAMILRFESKEEMLEMMNNMDHDIRAEVLK